MFATMPWSGRLGVPYQGSKNQIAWDIMGCLPSGKRFVDLFAGGCAITHAALLSGRYESFLANDIHGFGVRLFMDSIAGKSKGVCNHWVSREEFMTKRDSDPLVAICWSFGNNQAQYLYGEDIEEQKRKQHENRVAGKRTEVAGNFNAQGYTQVKSLEPLEELQRIDAINRISVSFQSYDEYEHQDGDVVYCDIPYRSATESYRFMRRNGMFFDFEKFYRWCESRDFPVFVSEYEMPISRFSCIYEKPKIALFKKTDGGGVFNATYGKNNERVFVQKKFESQFKIVEMRNISDAPQYEQMELF